MVKLQDNPAEGSREVIERELARQKADGGQKRATENPETGAVTARDVRRVLGELDAAKVADILALRPSLAELEEAAAWMAGEGDVPAQQGHPLTGKAAAIFDITEAAEDDSDPN
jgi:hypothetical protein